MASCTSARTSHVPDWVNGRASDAARARRGAGRPRAGEERREHHRVALLHPRLRREAIDPRPAAGRRREHATSRR